jgi:hypothetical protein
MAIIYMIGSYVNVTRNMIETVTKFKKEEMVIKITPCGKVFAGYLLGEEYPCFNGDGKLWVAQYDMLELRDEIEKLFECSTPKITIYNFNQ